MRLRHLAFAAAVAALPTMASAQQKTLRIAMTASDVPTTAGMPNNGPEGMRFLGFPIFEPLVDWDLTRADKPADIRPGLAESWAQDAADPRKWRFTLRQGVSFHDGTAFGADSVIWNLDRFYKNDSPQFDAPAAALARGRVSIMSGYRRVDDRTVEIETSRPISYMPYLLTWILFTSPQSYAAAGNDWGKVAATGAAGTGPFRITRFVPRVSAELARNDGYWNPDRKPKLDRILLLPMPEANTRLAALRSGQVDWIEVPPPDAIPA